MDPHKNVQEEKRTFVVVCVCVFFFQYTEKYTTCACILYLCVCVLVYVYMRAVRKLHIQLYMYINTMREKVLFGSVTESLYLAFLITYKFLFIYFDLIDACISIRVTQHKHAFHTFFYRYSFHVMVLDNFWAYILFFLIKFGVYFYFSYIP